MRRLNAPVQLSFQLNPWLEGLVVVRRNRPAAYRVAIAVVLLAFASRYATADHLGARMRFGVFFPAVLMAAVVGGAPAPTPERSGLGFFVLQTMANRFGLPPMLELGRDGMRYRLHIDVAALEPRVTA